MGRDGDIPGDDSQVGPPGQWPTFRDPIFLLLLRHWAHNRVGLVMPRQALDPAAIKPCLPHVWLYQYNHEDSTFVCRLSGEQVNDAWGVNMAGKRPEDFMPPESAAMANVIYRRILFTPALHVGHRRIAPQNRQEKAAERLVVPLSDAHGRAYGIFGLSLYYFDPITQAELPPQVGPNVTYFPCAALPASMP